MRNSCVSPHPPDSFEFFEYITKLWRSAKILLLLIPKLEKILPDYLKILNVQ